MRGSFGYFLVRPFILVGLIGALLPFRMVAEAEDVRVDSGRLALKNRAHGKCIETIKSLLKGEEGSLANVIFNPLPSQVVISQFDDLSWALRKSGVSQMEIDKIHRELQVLAITFGDDPIFQQAITALQDRNFFLCFIPGGECSIGWSPLSTSVLLATGAEPGSPSLSFHRVIHRGFSDVAHPLLQDILREASHYADYLVINKFRKRHLPKARIRRVNQKEDKLFLMISSESSPNQLLGSPVVRMMTEIRAFHILYLTSLLRDGRLRSEEEWDSLAAQFWAEAVRTLQDPAGRYRFNLDAFRPDALGVGGRLLKFANKTFRQFGGFHPSP